MRHDTAEQLNNWAAGSLWRYAGDRIIATVSTNVVVPSPTGGAEIAFVLEQGSGAQAAIVLERPAAITQVQSVMAGVLNETNLQIVGGAPAKLSLEVDANSYVTKLLLSVPGVLPEQAVTPDDLAVWLGRPWEAPTRRVTEVDDQRLAALLRTSSAQTMQLRVGGALQRTLASLAPFTNLVTPAGVVGLPDIASFVCGVVGHSGNADKLIIAQAALLLEPGRADIRPQCGLLFADVVESGFTAMDSLLRTEWPAVLLEALQTAARFPAVAQGAGVSRARMVGDALRRAALAALAQRDYVGPLGSSIVPGGQQQQQPSPLGDRNVRPRLQQSPDSAFRAQVQQHVASGASLDDALRAVQAQRAPVYAPPGPLPPPLPPSLGGMLPPTAPAGFPVGPQGTAPPMGLPVLPLGMMPPPPYPPPGMPWPHGAMMPPPSLPPPAMPPQGAVTTFARCFLVGGAVGGDPDGALAALGGPPVRDKFLGLAKVDMTGLPLGDASDSLDLMESAFNFILPRTTNWLTPTFPPVSADEVRSRVNGFIFAVSTSTQANPAADRGKGPVFHLEQTKTFTDKAKQADATARAVSADVVQSLLLPAAFVQEAQAAPGATTLQETRRLVDTHGNAAWGLIYGSSTVNGKLSTVQLPDGKSASPVVAFSFSAAHTALRKWVKGEMREFHGEDREKWLDRHEDLEVLLTQFATDLVEGKTVLKGKTGLVHHLAVHPGVEGAFLEAEATQGRITDGMGRWGSSESTDALWEEDLARALPRFERLFAAVHGTAGGVPLDAAGRFGLAGDPAKPDAGFAFLAKRAGSARRDQALIFVLDSWDRQCQARRKGQRQTGDVAEVLTAATAMLNEHLKPQRQAEAWNAGRAAAQDADRRAMVRQEVAAQLAQQQPRHQTRFAPAPALAPSPAPATATAPGPAPAQTALKPALKGGSRPGSPPPQLQFTAAAIQTAVAQAAQQAAQLAQRQPATPTGPTQQLPPPPPPGSPGPVPVTGIAPRVDTSSPDLQEALLAAAKQKDWKTVSLPPQSLQKPPHIAAAFHLLMMLHAGEDPLGKHGPSVPCGFAMALTGGCGSAKSGRPCPKCSQRAQWKAIPKGLSNVLKAAATPAMLARIVDTG